MEHPETDDLQHALNLIHETISRLLGLQKGKKSDLSPIATAILYQACTRKLQVTDISTTFDIKKSTASGYVDNLEKKGYVERQKEKANRRNTYVVPTEKGKRLVQTNEQVLADYIKKHMTNLTPQEQHQFIVLLSKFVRE
jgi:DNA-binding MarR family transcriptional regulator